MENWSNWRIPHKPGERTGAQRCLLHVAAKNSSTSLLGVVPFSHPKGAGIRPSRIVLKVAANKPLSNLRSGFRPCTSTRRRDLGRTGGTGTQHWVTIEIASSSSSIWSKWSHCPWLLDLWLWWFLFSWHQITFVGIHTKVQPRPIELEQVHARRWSLFQHKPTGRKTTHFYQLLVESKQSVLPLLFTSFAFLSSFTSIHCCQFLHNRWLRVVVAGIGNSVLVSLFHNLLVTVSVEHLLNLNHAVHQLAQLGRFVCINIILLDKWKKFPLAPMGVIAPGSAHARPSARPVFFKKNPKNSGGG